jgi:hypothetical protein
LPLFSLALCLVAQCLSLVIAVEAFSMTSVAEFAVDQSTIITVSLTSRAVYDLITAMGLVWYLMKQRSTALSRSIIDRLVLWTVGERHARIANIAHADPITLQKLV